MTQFLVPIAPECSKRMVFAYLYLSFLAATTALRAEFMFAFDTCCASYNEIRGTYEQKFISRNSFNLNYCSSFNHIHI